MPYIVGSSSVSSTIGTVSPTFSFPTGHLAGDLLLVLTTQRIGDGVISAPGFTEVGVQAAIEGQKLAAFYKIATASSEQVTLQSSVNRSHVVTLLVVRHFDIGTPIQAHVRTDSPNSTLYFLDSGQVTTVTDNCLLLYVCSFEGSSYGQVPLNQELTNVTKTFGAGGVTQSIGFTTQTTAGTTPVVRMVVEGSNEGGSLLLLAIPDATPLSPKMPARLASSVEFIGRLGAFPSAAGTRTFYRVDGLTWETNLGTIVPSTLFGKAFGAGDSPTLSSTTISDGGWTAVAFPTYYNTATNRYSGVMYSMPAKSFVDKIFSFEFANNTWNNSESVVLYLQDSAGAWVAYFITRTSDLSTNIPYRAFVDLNSTPDAASVASLDKSNIIKFAFLVGASSSATGVNSHWRNVVLATKSIVVGGFPDKPATFTETKLLAEGWNGNLRSFFTQGDGQLFAMAPFQIGDGVTPTFFNGSRCSLEVPAYTPLRIPERFWRVADLSFSFTINASPVDIINLSSSNLSAKSKQIFRVASSSSATASYKFEGANISGFVVDVQATGIPVSSVTFAGCYGVYSNSTISNCTFIDSKGASAAIASPDLIVDCVFMQGATGGHAIEITQPGTFSFVGNTFEGYGLDGTTDAAIYNNSGGHVVLNISGGGDTPTVRNGAGATTEVVSGAQITVVGLATGSQVKVTKVSNGDVLFNGAESLGEVSFSTTYIGAVRVDARKASASPFYKPWATQATTISGQTVEITALQELDE